MLSCLLNDLAYLLGLTCGRGRLDFTKRSLTIEVPFKSVEAEGISKVFNQRDKIIIGVDGLVNRIGEFTGKFVRKDIYDSIIKLTINFDSSTQTWQSLVAFFCRNQDYHSFVLPSDFINAPRNLIINFLKGFSDVAGFVRKSNYDRVGRYRVYLEIPNSNWLLPIQICQLLQSAQVQIPVQTITWGHPNTRGKGVWSKEHQVKIYAEYFTNVGFSIGYKNDILTELAEANLIKFGDKKPRFCDPYKKRTPKPKPITDDINSSVIHSSIRGIHFNSYWQICCRLGCDKCQKDKDG